MQRFETMPVCRVREIRTHGLKGRPMQLLSRVVLIGSVGVFAIGCGDGDSVPLGTGEQAQTRPAETFSAPLPSDQVATGLATPTGATDAAEVEDTDGEAAADADAVSDPVPVPTYTPEQMRSE